MKLIVTAIIIALACPLAYAANTEQQEFMSAVTASIEKVVVVPCETPQTAEIKVQLESFPTGYLKSITVVQGSGYPLYDKALLRAITAAQPFPPTDPIVLKKLGASVMYFRPGIPAYRCNLQPLDGEIPNIEVKDLPTTPKVKSK